MKKGCIAALVLVLAVAGGSAWTIFSRYNRDLGLTAAPAIPHGSFAGPETGLRVALEPLRARDLLLEVMGDDVKLPEWVPFDMETAMEQLMPHEVALLGAPDYARGVLDLVLYVNERRLGPKMAEELNKTDMLKEASVVTWTAPGFTFEKRGVIMAEGAMALPPYLEDDLLQYWDHRRPGNPVAAEGGHLFELTLDNRNGDAFMLWGAMTVANRGDWRGQLEDERLQQAIDMLVGMDSVRLRADLSGNDALAVRLEIEADPDTGPALRGLLNFAGLPGVQRVLEQNYGLELIGQADWDEAAGAVVANLRVSGILEFVKRQKALLMAAPQS